MSASRTISCILGGLLLLALGTVSTVQAAPTAAEFFATPAKRAPSLSPSGRYASMVWRQDNKFYVGIADLDGKEGTKFFSVGEEALLVSLRWLTDDRLLAEYTGIKRIEGMITYTEGGYRMAAFDRDGSNLVTLFDGQVNLEWWNYDLTEVTHLLYDDPDHILMPAYKNGRRNLYKVNVKTGKGKLVEKGSDNTVYWFANREGDPILRVDISDYGSVMSFFRKGAGGNWDMFKKFPYRDLSTIEHWPIAFGQTPTTQIVKARVKGEERFAIYLYDVEKDEYLKKVFDHPIYDVEEALISTQGDLLAGIYYDDRLQIVSDITSISSELAWLNQQFGNKANISPVSMSSRHSRAIIFVSSPTISGDYYLFDRKARQLSVLFKTRPGIDESVLGGTEIVHYNARDGLALTAYVTHPKGRETQVAPLIVLPHGGPEIRDIFDYDPLVQFLSSRGYRVLRVNFRGSGGYGREFAERGYGEWGGKMQDDVTDGVMQLVDRGLATPGNMCIAGISYGGYAALYGGLQSPDLYRCVVSIAGVSDLFALLEEEKRYGQADSESYHYWLKSVGDPIVDRERLISKSPALHGADFSVPVLLMHGRDDTVVYRSQSIYMERALKKAGKQVEYIEIEDEGHPGWHDANELLLYEKIEGFLRQHLPAN